MLRSRSTARSRGSLLRYFARKGMIPGEAEDGAQEVFLRLSLSGALAWSLAPRLNLGAIAPAAASRLRSHARPHFAGDARRP